MTMFKKRLETVLFDRAYLLTVLLTPERRAEWRLTNVTLID